MSKIQKKDHFYLIDGSGYIFRAYYALPPLSRKSDGLPTGAVSGFCSMLFKLLEDSKSNENLQKPTHFAVIFDSARKTFRNEIYSDYKANRSEPPDDLAPQFQYIRKSVLAFNLPSVELINYEADDLIATYSDQIVKKGAKVTIVSSDKDLMQLYKKKVRIYDPMKNIFITEEDTIQYQGYVTTLITDLAIETLNAFEDRKPFCLLYFHKAPHRNWMPDIKHLTMYDSIDIPIPKTFFDNYDTRSNAAKQQDMKVINLYNSLDMKIHSNDFAACPALTNLDSKYSPVWVK